VFSNTRQAQNSNTRQPAQLHASVDDNSDSPNTRQRAGVHLKKPPDVHMNRGENFKRDNITLDSAPNTRQALDAGAAFNYEATLFRLETYKDKYGRTICKRTVRFVRRRTGRNVGEVTPELAEALSRRPGKGRTSEARAEAERNRLLAESLAKRLRRAKTGRSRNAAGKTQSGRQAGHLPDAFGSELLPDVSDFPRDERTAYVH
jgi:hypothetical protein